nr:hypothetical protein [Tanacetum cinerariifolium]
MAWRLILRKKNEIVRSIVMFFMWKLNLHKRSKVKWCTEKYQLANARIKAAIGLRDAAIEERHFFHQMRIHN